jgi:transcriptional regulator
MDLLQGTLDMLILRTLNLGPLHGHGIAKHIQRTSQELLKIEHGSLYPALHRLERQGWIASRWEESERGRELKMYRLTAKGKKQLADEHSRWSEMSRAIGLVMES